MWARCPGVCAGAVILTTQSAQSPDVNLCDLAFFSASQMKVFKRRRQSNRLFDVDKLEADIKAEFKKYPVASLCDVEHAGSGDAEDRVR